MRLVIEEPEKGLHAKAVQAVMLLILELMDRGYRVAISTHSQSILEVLWAIRQLHSKKADASRLWEIFGLERARWDVGQLARHSFEKEYRVFYLDYEGEQVVSREISALDPGASDAAERSWGELLSQSARANAVVADANALVLDPARRLTAPVHAAQSQGAPSCQERNPVPGGPAPIAVVQGAGRWRRSRG